MNENTMEKLLDRFNKEYDKLYRERSAGTDEDLNVFDKIFETVPEIVRQFNAYRGDICSSDRECAAFARAFRRVMVEALY